MDKILYATWADINVDENTDIFHINSGYPISGIVIDYALELVKFRVVIDGMPRSEFVDRWYGGGINCSVQLEFEKRLSFPINLRVEYTKYVTRNLF